MEFSNLFFGAGLKSDGSNVLSEDLTLLHDAGMNCILLGHEGWIAWERVDGQYDFSSILRTASEAGKHGISCFVRIPGCDLPLWLAQSYPGIRPDSGDVNYKRYYRRLVLKMADICRSVPEIVGFLAEGEAVLWLRSRIRDGQTVISYADFASDYQSTGFSFGTDLSFLSSDADETAVKCRHPSGLANTGMDISFAGDLAYGLKKHSFLAVDVQSQGCIGQLPYSGQLRLQAYHHLACGSSGVLYDSLHSEPGYQMGILGYDGQPGRIYHEIREIGEELKALNSLCGLQKENRVAILASRNSMEHWDLPGSYNEYLRWVYDSFYRLNIEVDLIPESQRDFTGYELLVTPCLSCAEDNLLWAIRDFVSGGGKLLSTFHSFVADEAGVLRRDVLPYGMTDVFGVHYREFTIPEETYLPDCDCEVSEWMELLEPYGSQIVEVYGHPAWDGVPAVTCANYGKGSAAYIGCFSADGLEPVLMRLLAMWHIPVPEISWPVVVKRGINRTGRSVTFLLHYSAAERMIPSPAAGRELISGREYAEGEPMQLGAWDVKILEGYV